MPKRTSIAGQKFGNLKVTKFDKVKGGHSYWIVTCQECGSVRSLNISTIKRKKTTKCVCSNFKFHQAIKARDEKRRLKAKGVQKKSMVGAYKNGERYIVTQKYHGYEDAVGERLRSEMLDSLDNQIGIDNKQTKDSIRRVVLHVLRRSILDVQGKCLYRKKTDVELRNIEKIKENAMEFLQSNDCKELCEAGLGQSYNAMMANLEDIKFGDG